DRIDHATAADPQPPVSREAGEPGGPKAKGSASGSASFRRMVMACGRGVFRGSAWASTLKTATYSLITLQCLGHNLGHGNRAGVPALLDQSPELFLVVESGLLQDFHGDEGPDRSAVASDHSGVAGLRAVDGLGQVGPELAGRDRFRHARSVRDSNRVHEE